MFMSYSLSQSVGLDVKGSSKPLVNVLFPFPLPGPEPQRPGQGLRGSSAGDLPAPAGQAP